MGGPQRVPSISSPAHPSPGSGSGGAVPGRALGSSPAHPAVARTMVGLLALLGPAGRVSVRVRPRATWLLSAVTHCAPPPLTLALARPGTDSRLLRTARGDCRGHQVSLPAPTLTLISRCPERRASGRPLATARNRSSSGFLSPQNRTSQGSDPPN